MEQSPWEADIRSASQEISYLLRNPKICYHFHSIQPLVLVLSQMNPIHILTTYLFNIYFDIVFPSTPRSSKLSLPFNFSNWSFV